VGGSTDCWTPRVISVDGFRVSGEISCAASGDVRVFSTWYKSATGGRTAGKS